MHPCVLESCLGHLGVMMGAGGDEPLCLQTPVPPFIWDWVISGFPLPPGSSHPPKARKGSLCDQHKHFPFPHSDKAKHRHKEEHHSAGMQCVLIWGRVGESLSCKLFPSQWGINSRLIGAGLGLKLPAMASGNSSHPHGQCCSQAASRLDRKLKGRRP